MLPPARVLLAATACMFVAIACARPEPVDPFRPRGGIAVGIKGVDRINPSTASSPEELLMIGTSCDGLTTLDPETGEVGPGLAESWSFSPDGLQLTFRLKKGSRFQDGSALTSDDIRRSLLSIMGPASGSPWASLLKGIQGAGTAEVADSITSPSANRLVVSLARRSPDIVSAFGHPSLVPVSERSTDAKLICSGPYKILDMEDEGVRLVHAGDLATSSGATSAGRGHLNLIRFLPFASEEEAFEAFKKGQVQVAPVPVNRVVEAEAIGRSYARGSTLEMTYLTFTPGDSQTADPRVRQALSLAVDRLLLVDAAFGDQREPALRWLAQGTDEAEACARTSRKVSDPDGAKSLLVGAGVDPASVQLKINYDSEVFSKVVVQALEVKMRDVLGIQITLNPLSAGAFLTAASTREGGVIWLTTSKAQLPTLGEMVSSKIRSDGQRNLTGMSDQVVDAALDAAEAQGSRKARLIKAVEAENLVCEKMLGVPLWWGVSHWMVDDTQLMMRGKTRLDFSGGPALRQIALR